MRIFYQASDVSRKTEKNAFLNGLRNLTEKRKQNLSMTYPLLIIFLYYRLSGSTVLLFLTLNMFQLDFLILKIYLFKSK